MCRPRSVGIAAALKEVFFPTTSTGRSTGSNGFLSLIPLVPTAQLPQGLRRKLRHSSPQCNALGRRGCGPGRGHSYRHWDVGTSGSNQSLFAVSGVRSRRSDSEQQKTESWWWQGWRKQEGWRQRWCWSHEFRADHGFGPPEIISSVPPAAQRCVSNIRKRAVQRLISLQEEALMHRLWCRMEALQLLPLPASEACWQLDHPFPDFLKVHNERMSDQPLSVILPMT